MRKLSPKLIPGFLAAAVVLLAPLGGLADEMNSSDQQPSTEQFGEVYAKTVHEALGTGEESGKEFWIKQEQVVFGARKPDPKSNQDAKAVFAQADTPDNITLVYTPLDDSTPRYTESAAGEAMVNELHAALDSFDAKLNPTPADVAAVLAKLEPFQSTVEISERLKTPGIPVPPRSTVVYRTKPYCLQHNVGAPAVGAPMWLIPLSSLIPPGAIDIAKALLAYSDKHVPDQGIIQSLLWAIRGAATDPCLHPTPEQVRVLDAALPDGTKKFLAFMADPSGEKKKTGEEGLTTESSTDLLSISRAAKDIEQKNLQQAGIINHGKNPSNPDDVAAIIAALSHAPAPAATTTGPNGEVIDRTPKPDDAYSMPMPTVAAKVHAVGSLGQIEVVLHNSGTTTARVDPSDSIGMNRALTQPFAITAPTTRSRAPLGSEVERALAVIDETNARIGAAGDPGQNTFNSISWAILKRRANGMPVWHLIPNVCAYFTDGKTHPTITKILEVYLETKGGYLIDAYVNMDPEHHPEWDYDCHGFTMGDSRFWINDQEVVLALRAQPPVLVRDENPHIGDLVVYFQNGALVHSALLTSADTVTMAAGTMLYTSNGDESTPAIPGTFKTATRPVNKGWLDAKHPNDPITHSFYIPDP
jgi:hypothetical protein